MRTPQQSAINTVGGNVLAAVCTTDGAGAITLAGSAGVTAAAFVTDGTDGLIDLTLASSNANVIGVGAGSGSAGSFFVTALAQGANLVRLSCVDDTGAAAEDLAAATAVVSVIIIIAQ